MLNLVMKTPIVFLLLQGLAINGFAQIGQAGTFKPLYGEVTPVCECATLTQISLANTTIQSAALDPKDGSCRVVALVNRPPANDAVKVWIALPTKGWNGRFEGTGGGGFLGGHPMALKEPLAQGFAAGATDTGHEGGSGAFALDTVQHRLNWQLVRDNAYQGIHDMTVTGKALVQAFYGKPARYAYFVGGSTGGRQGLSEAQRFPDDYDGVMSYWPATNWHKLLMADIWPQAVMNEARHYVSAQKYAFANKAFIDAYDARDGLTDGVVDDPFTASFDLKTLVGKAADGETFTQADAEVIRQIWEGPRTKNGQFLWYGLTPGTDLNALGGTRGSPLAGSPFGISVEWIRYFLTLNPRWNDATLNRDQFELLWNQSVDQYAQVFGTDSPDLSRFRDRGGKLLMLHGLVDQLICPQGTIDYYERVRTQMGGPKKTAEFARLFLIPGIDHGNRGPGTKPIDHFERLVQWVETGKAPDRINAELRDKSGNLVRARSYAPYTTSISIR